MSDISTCPKCDVPIPQDFRAGNAIYCLRCREGWTYRRQVRFVPNNTLSSDVVYETVWEPASAVDILAFRQIAGMLPVAAAEPQPTPSAPTADATTPETTPYSALLAFAAEELKGDGRKTIELLCANNGRLALPDFALAMEWDRSKDGRINDKQWSSLQTRLNNKLRGQGWRLIRHDNHALLESYGSATKE